MGGGEAELLVALAHAPHPLAQRLGAQVEAVERERALQPGVALGLLELGAWQRRAGGGRREGLAELLAREHAVEVRLAGDAHVDRFGGVTTAGRGVGAAQPVDPVGGFALFGRHGLDRRAHRLPVADAQRRPHPPGALLGGGLDVAGGGVERARLGQAVERGVHAERQVGVVAFGGAEAVLDAQQAQACGGDVLAREAHERGERELAAGARHREVGRQAVEPGCRRADRLPEVGGGGRAGCGQQGEAGERGLGLAGIDLATDPPPHALLVHRAGIDRRTQRRVAGRVGVGKRVPLARELGEDAAITAQHARAPGVAAQLGVGVAQVGVCVEEAAPVAVPCQAAQPLGAQAFAEVGARFLGEEGLHGRDRHGFVGACEAVDQQPVARISVEGVGFAHGGEAFQRGAVALAQGLASGDDTFVARLVADLRERAGGGE